MAVMWMDNFSMYGTGSAGVSRMLNGLYACADNEAGSNPQTGSDNTLAADPDPTATGIVYRMGDRFNNLGSTTTVAFTNTLRRVFPLAVTTVGVGFRVWFNSLPSNTVSQSARLAFKDASNNTLFNLEVGPIGDLIAWRGTVTEGSSAGSVARTDILGQTTGPVIVTNAWQHIEVKTTLDSTTGAVEVRVDGVTVLTLTNVNTSASDLPASAVAWHNFQRAASGVRAPVWFIKDIVSWNTLGSYNNNFIGPVAIVSLVPNGDDALNWTPVGASNGWSILDNSPPVDTQYIAAGVPLPSAYRANMTNLPVDVTSIRALQPVVRARKVDGGDGNIQVSLVSGPAEQALADRPITPTFTYWADISEEDPNTSAAWTPAAVDAVIVKINRTV